LAKAVAGETNAHFISISGPEIMGKYYGESEERLREIFNQAEENSPSIIFIDEIDSIAPKRDEVTGEVEKRIVSQLLALMDGMKSRGKVVVIAATNRPDSIDPALRRPGRFDREIEIGIPDDEGRYDILSIHTRGMPIDEKVDLKQISKTTHGFVGADLEFLSKEAAMRSLRRILPEIDLDEDEISKEILQKIQITSEDFREALKEVRPSALREVQVQVPNVSWDDVGGLTELKEELREAVEWPLKYKEAFDFVNVEAPKGILLHGPPGTGKTLIAKALAKMTESNFISIKGPELLSKWVGESEKGVREIFRKARQVAPCIIFLDEIDALVPRRGSGGSESHVTQNVVSQILTEIDGLEELHNVLIIGATNRLDIVDEALLRPGRFDRIIEVPNPDSKGREQIFKIHTKKKPLADNVSISKLVELTNGFSGAEIAAVANRAATAALKRYVNGKSENIKEIKVTQQDLLDAIDKVQPRKTESPMIHSIK
jgi:transitional endoplasmic reticulum ATPase